MRLLAEWLPLLLCCWAGSVAAAADCSPSSGTFTINSADDVTTLNQCTTFSGNVTVAAKGIEDITFNGLKTVAGILQIQNVDAVLSISSTTLASVQELRLSNLPNLTTLTLPALTDFAKLDFTGLTSLRGCEIATGSLKRDVNEVSIINTALEKMDWLKWPVATTLTIGANKKLTNFSFPYDQISAGSSYQISMNKALTNLDFSQLSGIYGSLAINGNSDPSLNFDNLETIDGYVRLSGPFTNITMPQLTEINGALRAESTRDILSFCDWLSVQDRLFGHYDCTANTTSQVTSSAVSSNTVESTSLATGGTSSGGNGSNDKKSDLSTGAIIGIAVAMVVVVSIGLTSAALLFFRRRSRKRTQQAQEAAMVNNRKTHSTSTLGEELIASGIRYELGGEKTATELSGAAPAEELDGERLQELDCPKPYFRDHKPAPDSPLGRFELP